jgi:hypothetical protein
MRGVGGSKRHTTDARNFATDGKKRPNSDASDQSDDSSFDP